MIDDIPTDKIIRTAFRYGADFAEVFAERTRRTTVVCDDDRIEQAAAYFDCGVGIRAFSEGRVAYGSISDPSRRDLLELAKRVGLSARAKHTKPAHIALNERRTDAPATVRTHPSGILLGEKCSVVMRANDTARHTGKQVRQVRASYDDTVRRIWVATSEGTFISDEQVGTVFRVQAVAGDETTIQTGYEVAGGAVGFDLFEETLPEEIAQRAARRAIAMLGARPAPAGAMPVVLSSGAGGVMFHEAVGHGLEADCASEGLSVYSGRIGDKVASDLVTLADDATLTGKRGSFTFDDEGTPSQRTVLIERGILKGYLSDRLNSQKGGSPPTGNCRRESYREAPIVRMTNMLVLPGSEDPESILSDTPEGLFVSQLGGGQVNPVSGDFVFKVQEGYLIDKGKLGDPVRGATLTGNGPRVLLAIDRVGSDMGYSIGMCRKKEQSVPVSSGQPTLRISEIVVGGTG